MKIINFGVETREDFEIKQGLFLVLAEELARKGIWVNCQGEPMKIKNMTETHIINCIKMLKKSDSPAADIYIERLEKELKEQNTSAF